MKKIVVALFLCGISLVAQAQNSSVEKSVFGAQVGFLGVWVHNEAKLTDKLVLRSELGLDSGIFSGSYYDDIGFFMTPVITLEPKFYYNLNKRVAKSKNISGNSGNYISLKTSYNPNWFVISSTDNISITDQISMVPTWGIRRVIGSHFNYEVGFGIGWRHYFEQKVNNYILEADDVVDVNLQLRIGYKF